jgi:hypothetical protein
MLFVIFGSLFHLDTAVNLSRLLTLVSPMANQGPCREGRSGVLQPIRGHISPSQQRIEDSGGGHTPPEPKKADRRKAS